MLSDPLIGRQFANFRVERAIGRGGMAQVYYGQDVKLHRPVAIKVIDARLRGSPAYAQRFVHEAQAVALWRHEHIIQIYYANDEGGLYYFVMEYIDGQDLGSMIAGYRAKGKLLLQADVLRIGKAVAEALDYAHRKGVIHRDVKPSNILVGRDGRVVLTDFGLALDVEQGSLGEVFGSSRYIAPEQARRSSGAVPQSDLYSLGVILYEMLTGSAPFDDPSPTAVALQHVTLAPPPPRGINPKLNAETEAVLLKALSKSPKARYKTGGELMAALERALLAGKPAPRAKKRARAVARPAAIASRDRSPDNLIGRQVDEYRLEALLGQGGMASVYRGLDVRLNRQVAIKVIDTPFRADVDHIRRFEREAQAIAQLEHPHIVRLYRYGQSDSLLYMAMQYVEGQNLQSMLAAYRKGRQLMPADKVRRIIREICLALDYAHSKGVIHRDVKPSNIMLDKDGNAILTDFGLALLTEVGTRGEILGSPHYIAPEQAISSANVVPQSDLYAVGVILYEMLTGEVPFDAPEPLDVAMLQMTEPPPSPRKLRPDISPGLETVLLKALAKTPEKRYPSGAALADALDAALRRSPLPKTTVPVPVTPRKPAAPPPAQLPPIPAAVAGPSSRRQPAPPSLISAIAASPPSATKLAARPGPGRRRSFIAILAFLGIAVLVLATVGIVASLGVMRGGGLAEASPPPPAEAAVISTAAQAAVSVKPSPSAQPPLGTPGTVAIPSPSASAQPPLGTETPLPDSPTATPSARPPIETATPTEVPPSPTVTPTETPTPSASAQPPLGTPTLASGAAPRAYRLAFTKVTRTMHTIWVADLDGANAQRLLDFAASPSWSPDGRDMAFVGEQGIEAKVKGGTHGVWKMSAAGGNPTQLKQDGSVRSVTWMPVKNSTSIAYDSKRGDYGVYFVDGYGTDQAGAIPGEQPAWSPDGQRLVMRACRPDCGLWITNRDGSRPVQLTWGATDGLPAWSPDGQTIAFSRGSTADIYVIPAAGGQDPQRLTDARGHDTLPAWTPDSQQIAFRSARAGRWQIFVMNADGSDQHMVIDNAPIGDDWMFDRMSVVER
jgi:serine/threonine protein kinase